MASSTCSTSGSASDLTIESFMQPAPHSIAAHETLAVAKKMLSEFGFRHLPVQEGGRLLGVLSDRDISRTLASSDREPNEIFVRDCYSEDPYVVEPTASLSAVVRRMGEERLGCALIIKNERLVGIFTTVDACLRLATLLEETRCGSGPKSGTKSSA